MAGDWIKMRTKLATDPDVIQIAAQVGVDEFGVVGRLHAVWSWLDSHSQDGVNVRIAASFLDRLTGCTGFAAAMKKVGWLAGEDGAITFPGYSIHNGDTAKRRAADASRKHISRTNVRKMSAKCPDKSGHMSASRGTHHGQDVKTEGNVITPLSLFSDRDPASPPSSPRKKALFVQETGQMSAKCPQETGQMSANDRTFCGPEKRREENINTPISPGGDGEGGSPPAAAPPRRKSAPTTYAPCPDSDYARRIARMFRRRTTSLWTTVECRKFAALAPSIDQEEFDLLEDHYLNSGCKFLRKDLVTFLNNYQVEIDRARNYRPDKPEKASSRFLV